MNTSAELFPIPLPEVEGHMPDRLNPLDVAKFAQVSQSAGSFLESRTLINIDGSMTASVKAEESGEIIRIYLKTRSEDGLEETSWITVAWEEPNRDTLRYLKATRSRQQGQPSVYKNSAYDVFANRKENTLKLKDVAKTVNLVRSFLNPISA